MIRKMLETLPFFHHQPPRSTPLRKAVIMSLQRPVDIKKIESYIGKQLNENAEQTIIDLKLAIEYLQKPIFSRTDFSNLFVAGVRAVGHYDLDLGIQFGKEIIAEIPDMRAIRSLVTFMNRAERYEEIPFILRYSKDNVFVREKRNYALRLTGSRNDGAEGETMFPWTFELERPTKLTRKPTYFRHKFDDLSSAGVEGLIPEFELYGKIKIAKTAKSTGALVRFEFFDSDSRPLNPAKIKGLTHSNNVGWYSYLRQDRSTGEFLITFELPEQCAFTNIGFQTWHAKTSVKLLPGFEIRSASINQFHLDFNRFMNYVEHSEAEELVFMFSGTTYVQDVRANRPIRLTRELMKRGIPVIFNYHRWRRTDEHPDYADDLLFQIPIDVTKQFMAKLATLKTSKKKIFIVSYPHPVIPKILNRFKINGWLNLYDARDDWEEFQKVGQAKWYNSGIEKYIVRNCDNVTAVSWPLAKKLDAYDPLCPVRVVPNALSPNFLSKNYKWKGSSQTKVGYFGHLTSSWFDWDSLIEIANSRPYYHFEIIGHSAPEDLQLPQNIDLMGPKNHPEINVIAAQWKVAIIPFKPGPLADAVDPIKIYEYMALNLPTVSFRMPQIDSYPYTITVESNEEFATAIDEFVRYQPKKGTLRKWLSTNTWGNRVDDMLELSNQPQNDGLIHLGVEN